MKVIGIKMIDDVEILTIIECISMEIYKNPDERKSYNSGLYRVCMRSTHPSVSFFIIKTERYDTNYSCIRPYKWLSMKEAEAILKCAAESDVIDLRNLGNYQICHEETIQSVMIMNDIDIWSEEEQPILVKVVDSDE